MPHRVPAACARGGTWTFDYLPGLGGALGAAGFVVEITENVIELTKLRCANVKLMSRLPWWYDLRGGWFLGVVFGSAFVDWIECCGGELR